MKTAEVDVVVDAFKRGPVLDTRRAAEYCGLAAGTMYNLRSSEEGPTAYKHGRKTVYYPADLDRWLASRIVPAPNPKATDQ